MTTLKLLTQSAMLGTGNGFTPPVFKHLQIPDTDPEAALLASAAVVGTAEMGGVMPVLFTGNEEVSPAESRPQMPERAASLFKHTLDGEYGSILTEFLQLIAARGLVVPPETLPALLGKKDLRSLVVQLTGARGRWLAAQNPAWAYALGKEPWDAWEHGARIERVSALERIRASEPGLARSWVKTTWDQDAPEDRAAFLRAFAIGLNLEDEPFLEACLDDKRKEVRDGARELLMRLEGSLFSQRMWARVRPCLHLKSKFLGGDKLEVILPENLDSAAKRDGIGGLQLRKKIGVKANLLAQMVSLVPPARWSREFGRTPEKLITAVFNCEWKQPVLMGWQLATQNAKDPDWAEAFASLWVTQDTCQQVAEPDGLGEMILLIRPEKIEALVKSIIKPLVKELDDQSPLLTLLERYHHPWTAAMARTVVGSVQRQSGNQCYRLPFALPGFANWIPPELAEEFASGWVEELKGSWREPVDLFLMTLKFRNEIRQSLME